MDGCFPNSVLGGYFPSLRSGRFDPSGKVFCPWKVQGLEGLRFNSKPKVLGNWLVDLGYRRNPNVLKTKGSPVKEPWDWGSTLVGEWRLLERFPWGN